MSQSDLTLTVQDFFQQCSWLGYDTSDLRSIQPASLLQLSVKEYFSLMIWNGDLQTTSPKPLSDCNPWTLDVATFFQSVSWVPAPLIAQLPAEETLSDPMTPRLPISDVSNLF